MQFSKRRISGVSRLEFLGSRKSTDANIQLHLGRTTPDPPDIIESNLVFKKCDCKMENDRFDQKKAVTRCQFLGNLQIKCLKVIRY